MTTGVQLKPVVVLVGRPNVGKSTLFNRLTRSRAALVADFPGLTRDRHYGEGRIGKYPYIVVDTGGFEPVAKDGIVAEMARQTRAAIDEADVVIFIADGRAGLTAQDRDIADLLRRSGARTILAVNKLEGMREPASVAEFYELGLGTPRPISAAHGDGVVELIEEALGEVAGSVREEPDDAAEPGAAARADAGQGAKSEPAAAIALEVDANVNALADEQEAVEERDPSEDKPEHPIRLAVVGRPNVGKSTLVNALLGEERVIVFDQPGTTRDAIEVEFERQNRRYVLIDTAGLRRRGRVFEAVEKFSVIKTLQAIEAANVVVLVLDAQAEISEQDANIAGFIVETGRALVVAINKWDGLDAGRREWVKREYARKLRFLSFAPVVNISALHKRGIGQLMSAVNKAYAAAFAKLPTPRLTRELHNAVEQQPPPRKGIIRPKLRYAHQGGQNPPRIIIHGNALDAISDTYRRYLEARFRAAFKLQGTPLRIEFRSSHNPYVD